MAPLWGLIAILIVVSNSLSPGVQAAQSTYLNFQARLLTNSGAVVPDGYYHVEFKLYNVVSGGTAQWTETWSSGDNSNRIRVVNGYLTANLGADTAFPGTIAWDEQLWLTMNIGGTGGAASWDGEMSPRILLTALPYAFKSAETLMVKKVSGANTGTLSFNTVANSPAIVLPDASGTVCLQSSSSCGFVTGAAADYIQNGTSVQTANFNIQSAAAGSIAALISGASGQSVDILQVKADGVANPLFKIGSTGDATFRPADSATAFQIQKASNGNNVLLVDTTSSSAPNGYLQVNAYSIFAPAALGSGSNNNSVGVNIDVTSALTGASTGRALNVTLQSTGNTFSGVVNRAGAFLLIDANASSMANQNAGLHAAVSGSNTSATNIGVDASAVRGFGVKGLSSSAATAASTTGLACGNTASQNNSIGVCGESSASANSAYNAYGVYGVARGGTGATAYGGYFTLNTSSTATATALYASNASVGGNILQLQDNTTDVFTVSDGGAILAKNQTNSTTAFQVQNANGNAYILVDTSGANLALGNTGIASTVQIGNTTGAVAQTINIGTNVTASSSTTINVGSTLGAVNLNGNTTVASTRTLTVAGGRTTLTANGAANGDALHVSNSTGVGNIAIFNDDGTAVLSILNDGGTVLTPLSSYTGTALRVTQAGNPGSGEALIKANNTNGTPTGNLLSLQTNGTTQFNVDTSGNVNTSGQLSFTGTGNSNSTIRKNMNTTGTVAVNDVVILHSTAGTVSRTTTASDTKIFGIATAASNPQDIVISGIYQVNLDSSTANVAIGDFLVTSTEAGTVTKSSNPPTGAVLGRALSTTGVAGAGQKVWVHVTPGIGGSTDSLQTAYNNSTSPEIVLNTTNHGISIQDASGGVTGNLFEVQSNGGSSTYLGVSATATTIVGGLAQSGGAISLQGNNNSSITTTAGNLTIDATAANAQILIGTGTNAHIINIGTGGTGNQAVTIGSTNAGSSTVIQGGNNSSIDFSNFDVSTAGTVTVAAGQSYTGAGAVTLSSGSTADLTLTSASGSIKTGTNNSVVLNGTGNLVFSQNGNTTSTIRKNMTVSTAVTAGDIVIINTASAGTVTTTSTANSNQVFGVATTTNAGTNVAQDIVTGGVYQVNVVPADGVAGNDIAVGDFITTSTTAGKGQKNTDPPAGTVIGRALSTDDASDKVWIYVTPGAGGTATTLQQAYLQSSGIDITLTNTGSAGVQINAGDMTAGSSLFSVQSANNLTKYLDVTSSGIAVTGTATVSTSLQAPLINTGSGNLALQPATGIVSLNTAGQTNELRVYDSGPTNYTYIRHGTIATSAGALTLDTGSAAAINIGTTNANAINLQQNTNVASSKTFSVQGGLTSLNANSGANGDALHASNGTGAGNIAVFNDDGTAVMVVGNDGGTTISPLSSNTGSALTITQAGNPSAGNALIKANNTNGTPSGNLLALQTGGVNQVAVDTAGNITTTGQLSFSGTGNTAGTIRKNMIVSTAVNANDVVIINVSAAGRVTTTTTADSTQVFGIATTTNAGTNVAQDIVTGGVYQVNISPADGIASNDVAVGDFITTSATSGRGKVNNSAPAGTVIGRALSTDDASDKVWIYVTPGAGGSPTNLQQAYNLSTTPEITVDSTRGALTIQDAASPLGANLFEVQSNGGGTKYFSVTSSGVAVTGTATVSTSLQTPLVTTGSGNLSLQPATGIVTLNRASTANELRVYENAASPTNYISIRNGSVTTSSGTLTLDTGSAAAINIGTSGSPTANAINLNVDTTVASTKTLTVAGGLTSLTANASINGEGLNVSNSTGTGNIAVFKDGSGAGTNVVTIANDGLTTFKNTNNSSTAFQVQNAIGSAAFIVDSTALNSLITNSNFEDTNISAWSAKGGGSIARDTSVGPYMGLASLQVTAGTAAGNGAKYDVALSVASYSLSFSVRQVSGTALSASNFEAGWNNGSIDTACTLNPALSSQAPVSGGWVRYSCTFTGSASGHVYWKLSNAVGTSAVYNIDAVQLEQATAATAYKETGLSLNGRIDSAVALRNKSDSTTAFQVQNSSGSNSLVVDTLNRRVGIALNTAPTQALEVGGNILASGTVTASDFNFASGTTAHRRHVITKSLQDTLNNYVEIGQFTLSNGAHNYYIGATIDYSGLSISKQYMLALKWNHTNNVWKVLVPIADSGADNGENFSIDINVSNDTATFRLRRTAFTSVTGASVNITIEQLGYSGDTFTSLSGVGNASTTDLFSGTSIKQDGLNGRVGIQNTAPAYTLDVTGTINSSSTISATTSVQTPLLTTGSGNLAIQSATGVVSINTTGQTNELRVYDSGPTNYTYIRNGTIATSTGALAIDTGNASAINIGSTNANAINLGTHTVLAATKNLTVTSGTTSLSANSATNGNALTVSNGTGTGNIAIFSDDSTQVLTVADQGILTVRNLTNSATGFQVQNASGHASLVLDTTNKHLKIYEIPASGSPVDYADIYYDYGTKTANYTASSGTVAVGTGAGAITITSGSGAAVNITGDAASLWRTTSGSLTLQSASSSDLILNSGSSIVTVSGSNVLKLGSSAGDPGVCTAGAVVYNSSTSRLRGCEGSTWQNLTETLQEAYNISISTSPEIKVDTTRGSFDIQDANSTVSGDLMTVRATNAGGLGTVLFGVDSSGNTRLQNTSGTNLLKANGTSSRVEIGSPTSHASNPIILVLDNYNNATEPTGTNGAIYYNVAVNKFRCYENSAWKDCISGFNTVTKTTDQAANPSQTAIQEDNTLRFSVAANTSYIFEAWIPVDTSDANADLRYTFTTPSGATMQILTTRPSSSGSSTAAYNVCSITTSANACLDTTVNSTANFIKVEGYLANGINAGTVIFQFAQSTSTATSFPVIKAGATLSWHTTN